MTKDDIGGRGVSQEMTDDDDNTFNKGDTINLNKTLIKTFIYSEIHTVLDILCIISVPRAHK
jgi:hypothetical protein